MATEKPDLHAIFSDAIALASEEERVRYVADGVATATILNDG